LILFGSKIIEEYKPIKVHPNIEEFDNEYQWQDEFDPILGFIFYGDDDNSIYLNYLYEQYNIYLRGFDCDRGYYIEDFKRNTFEIWLEEYNKIGASIDYWY